ncbi:MAG: hypothetical protein QM668_10475 [Agriterribacter sp.]
MEENSAKKDWVRIFSPAILGVIFSIIGIIVSYAELNGSGGWSLLGIIALAPVVIILLAVDVFVKLIFFRYKTAIIWLVEILALGLVYLLWISRFG